MKIKMFLSTTILSVFSACLCNLDESPTFKKDAVKGHAIRSRHHVDKILSTKHIPGLDDTNFIKESLQKISSLYVNYIKEVEEEYYFNDMDTQPMSEGEIFALPMVTLLGPWSTGKSSFINYILGIENTSYSLDSGAQPTTSDFTVISFDENHKISDGNVLVMDNRYSSLAKYGKSLLERLKSINLPIETLKMVNFVDTPGVIENRKQQERGFPFDDICKWFIDKSDLIIIMFDPTKLDVGLELEKIFRYLKGQEAKVRIVLNKGDTITSSELLRVYGSLFWTLSPLVNVTEPPRVHISSFWSKPYQTISKEFEKMFINDESALLYDIQYIVTNRLKNKIAQLRRHAILVRNHALVVDSYVQALAQQRSIFSTTGDVANSICDMPHKYKIYQKVLTQKDVCRKDLFSPSDYQTFFYLHAMESFTLLSKRCGFISMCLLDAIENVIYNELPNLVKEIEKKQSLACSKSKTCKVEL